ncbi:hypothetical protein [Bosea sp. BK604]|uniref:hypothetical protein n=1 Tax=Bosea sp. BK604 TaxID=2512180 RepID=UPI00104AE20C|nr:hypothetical protein [Bosea sp. BK604]TCR65605.1 hypothetical protein EV560_105368 [Bosea sp. BK604]
MIILGYLLSLFFLILGGGLLYLSWDQLVALSGTQGVAPERLAQMVQIAMAFVGAIAAAILTATIGRSNEYLKSKLAQSVNDATETLRQELALRTGKALEDHKGDINRATAEFTERLKSDLAKTGDTFRAELSQLAPRRHAAYHAMWAALAQYFRAVQKFEAGVFDASALEAGEKACSDATGQTLLVDQEDDATFHQFWQELTYVCETGELKKDLPDGLRTLWRNEGRKLGERYDEVRTAFATKLRS